MQNFPLKRACEYLRYALQRVSVKCLKKVTNIQIYEIAKSNHKIWTEFFLRKVAICTLCFNPYSLLRKQESAKLKDYTLR